MSDLSISLARTAARILLDTPMDARIMAEAAKRLEEYERDPVRVIIDNNRAQIDDMVDEALRARDEINRLRGIIMGLRDDLSVEQSKVQGTQELLDAANRELDNHRVAGSTLGTEIDRLRGEVTRLKDARSGAKEVEQSDQDVLQRMAETLNDVTKAAQLPTGTRRDVIIDRILHLRGRNEYLQAELATVRADNTRLIADNQRLVHLPEGHSELITQLQGTVRTYQGYLNDIGRAVDRHGLSYKDLAAYFVETSPGGFHYISNENEMVALRHELTQVTTDRDISNRTLMQIAQSFDLENHGEGWHLKLIDIALGRQRQITELRNSFAKGKFHDVERAVLELERNVGIKVTEPGDLPSRVDAIQGHLAVTASMLIGAKERAQIEITTLRNELAMVSMARDASSRTLIQIAQAVKVDIHNAGWQSHMLYALDVLLAQEDKFKRELAETTKRADAAEGDLAETVNSINLMWSKLQENKTLTGCVWPARHHHAKIGDVNHAKIADVAWCVDRLISKVVGREDRQSDTKFLADLAAAIENELKRRNK